MAIIERHLPFFVVTAEEEHFQHAAARLHITQSALSRRIQILEGELGVQLFERLPRGVRLTAAGTRFYEDVRKLRFGLDEAVDRARNISRGTVGALNIGLNASALQIPVLVAGLNSFREENPGVVIKYKLLFSEEQLTALERGALDVGILYKLSKEPWAAYQSISASDEMVLAMPKTHPLAKKRPLRLSDLASAQFIWPTRDLAPLIYDRMLAACHAGGLSPKIALEVRSDESILNIVATGLLIGCVNSRESRIVPASVVVRSVEDFSMKLPLHLVWRTDNEAPAVTRFVSTLAAAAKPASKRPTK